jgi:hypothetical protein
MIGLTGAATRRGRQLRASPPAQRLREGAPSLLVVGGSSADEGEYILALVGDVISVPD